MAQFDPRRPFQVVGGGGFDPSQPFAVLPAVDVTQGDGSVARPTQRSLGERFSTVTADAMRRNPVVAVARALMDSRVEFDGLKPHLVDNPIAMTDPETGRPITFASVGEQMRQDERERRDAYQTQAESDGWRQARGGPVGQGVAGLTNIAGAFTGAVADPTSIIGGPSRTVAARIVGNAAVNAVGDVVTQGADIGANIQDKYSLTQTGLSALIGGGIQGGFEVAGNPRGAVQAARETPARLADWARGIEGRAREFTTPRPPVDARTIDAGFDPAQPFAVEPSRPRAQAQPAPRRTVEAPPAIQRVIDGAVRPGVTRDYLTRLAERESGFEPGARAGTSSATGLYQFTDDTWLGTLRRHGAELGVPDAEARIAANLAAVLAMRNDPALSARAAARLTQDNASALRRVLGRAPTDAELYSAHFLGESGASRLATADPNASAASLLPAAARSNRSIFYEGRGRTARPRTVAELRQNFGNTFEGGSAQGMAMMATPEASAVSADFARRQGPQAPPPIEADRAVPLGRQIDYLALAEAERPTTSREATPEPAFGGFDPRQPFEVERRGPVAADAGAFERIGPDLLRGPAAAGPEAGVARLTMDGLNRPRLPLSEPVERPSARRDVSTMAPEAPSGFNPRAPFTVEGPGVPPSPARLPQNPLPGLNDQAFAFGGRRVEGPGFDMAKPFKPDTPAPTGRLAMAADDLGPIRPSRSLPIDLSAYGDRLGAARGPAMPQDIGGLRNAPRPGAVARGAGVAYQGQTVSGLASDLRTALGITQRQGRLTNRHASGEYDTGTAVIRTRAVQELDVLAHEATHALEYQRSPALQAALKQHAAELSPLAYPGAARDALRQEGFAEFGRWYLTNPEQARSAAPNFYAAFEQAVAADKPDVAANLKAIQQSYQDLLSSDSIEVAKGSLAYTGRKGLLRDLAREFKERGGGSVIGRISDTAYTAFIDDLHPLSMAVRRLSKLYNENTGRPLHLKRADDPYALARLAREAYAAGHNDIVYGVTPYRGLDPEGVSLADALDTAGIPTKRGKFPVDSLKEFDVYLIARRMIHEWDAFGRGELPRPPDRNTRQFHEQVIADAEAAHPTWSKAAGQVYDWLGALWKKERDAGLITDSAYQNGLTAHPDYVPLMRDVSDKGAGGGGKPRGALQFAGGVKQFEGSTRDIISPLSTMMRRSYELNAIVKRNDVLKALDDLAEKAGPGSGAIVERLPPDQMEAWTTDAADVLRRTADELGLSGRDLSTVQKIADDSQDETVTLFKSVGFSPKKGEAVVFVWRDGKKQPLLLPDGEWGKDMYDGITGLSRDQRNAFVDMVAAPTQLLRYGVTLSPEFMGANLIRDQIATWINTDVNFRPVLDTVRGATSELSQDAVAKRYATVGGMRGGANVAATQRPFPRTDADAIKQLQHLQTKGYKVRRFASWRGLAEATDLSETSTRLGVFRKAFEKAKAGGLGDYEAMVEAGFTSRDYLDFGRRGSRMIAASRLVTFLNAALQGLDKTTRVLSGGGNLHRTLQPLAGGPATTPAQKAAIGHAMKAWTKVSMLGALGLGLRMLYADDPEYQEIGDQLRATHWVFKMDGRWTFVPKPFELATISNILERGYEGMVLKDPKAGERLLSDFKHSIVPPYELPALSVPMQIARNRTSLGVPIVPDHLRGTVDPALQFNSYTSALGKMIGKTLNVSPAVVDHIMSGFGGTLARYVQQGSNLAEEQITGRPRTAPGPEDTFLVRRFIRDINRGSTSQAEFWDQVSRDDGDMSRALGTFRQMVGEAKDSEAVAYLNRMDPAHRSFVKASYFTQDGSQKLHPMVRAQQSLGVIGDLRRTIRDGTLLDNSGSEIAMTPDQRRQVDDALTQMGTVEMRNALVATGVEGWAQKSYLDHRAVDARLTSASPGVAAALRQALMLNRVPDEETVLNVWPQMRAAAEAPLDPRVAGQAFTARRMQGDTAAKVSEIQRMRAAQRIGQ